MKHLLNLRTIFQIFTILFIGINQVFACSCFGTTSTKEAIKESDAVLVGQIINKENVVVTDISAMRTFPKDTLGEYSLFYESHIVKYDLLITEVYKGKIKQDTIKIFTGNGGGDCGFQFKVGMKYIIYGMKKSYLANKRSGFNYPSGNSNLWTNSCMRTTLVHQKEINSITKHKRRNKNRPENKK